MNELTPLTTAIFRVFLANGNEPLTPVELAEELGRPADTILRTIGGFQVYHGIKPVPEEEVRRVSRRKAVASEEQG